MFHLLSAENCTVTLCHSRTRDLAKHTLAADIVVVAIGKPNFVKAEHIKPGAVVIDVGVNAIADSSKKSGYRYVGDVEFDTVANVAGAITPVPGGVGPMTVAMLVQNTFESAMVSCQGMNFEMIALQLTRSRWS
jgi:methylenetetrahydrofolate dehydrogenase (NADP+)/methenyltetrahydrofolate cyclohydrolase/formyltetrahydrofolate synthetase